MDSWQALAAQRFAMWEDGSFGLVRHRTQVERVVATQWDVAPLPKGPRQRDTLATHDGWAIWKGSKVAGRGLGADEVLAERRVDGDQPPAASGQQPARKSFQDGWIKAIKEANPLLADKNLKPFTDAIQQGYARPKEFFARKQLEAERIVDDLLNVAVYSAETGTTIKNGEQALDTAVKSAVRRLTTSSSRCALTSTYHHEWNCRAGRSPRAREEGTSGREMQRGMRVLEGGGHAGTRTPDLYHVKVAL